MMFLRGTVTLADLLCSMFIHNVFGLLGTRLSRQSSSEGSRDVITHARRCVGRALPP